MVGEENSLRGMLRKDYKEDTVDLKSQRIWEGTSRGERKVVQTEGNAETLRLIYPKDC